MVEHAFKRKLPCACCTQREREHRSAAGGRHDRTGGHRIAQRHAARAQAQPFQIGRARGRGLERVAQRAVRAACEQRCNAAARGQAHHADIARTALDPAAQRILVHRTGQARARGRGRTVVIDRHGQRAGGRDAVAIGIGAYHEAAEVDCDVVLGPGHSVVEHAFQRKLPCARRAQREREHRSAAGGRHDRTGGHRIAQRHAARGEPQSFQIGRARGCGLERIGERTIRTAREQRRDAAARGQAHYADIARTALDPARQLILVHRTGQARTRSRGRRVVVDIDRQRAVGRVVVAIGHPVGQRERRIVLLPAIGMQHIGVLRDRIGARRRIQRHRHQRDPCSALPLLHQDIAAARHILEAGRRAAGQKGDRAAVIAEVVRQRADGVRRIGIDIADTARDPATQRLVVELDIVIGPRHRRIVAEHEVAADRDGRAVGIAVAIGRGRGQRDEIAARKPGRLVVGIRIIVHHRTPLVERHRPVAIH